MLLERSWRTGLGVGAPDLCRQEVVAPEKMADHETNPGRATATARVTTARLPEIAQQTAGPTIGPKTVRRRSAE